MLTRWLQCGKENTRSHGIRRTALADPKPCFVPMPVPDCFAELCLVEVQGISSVLWTSFVLLKTVNNGVGIPV